MSDLFWTTAHEIEFLKVMGTGKNRKSEISRKDILKNYLDSMKLRKNWCGVDQFQVFNFVKSLIRNL